MTRWGELSWGCHFLADQIESLLDEPAVELFVIGFEILLRDSHPGGPSVLPRMGSIIGLSRLIFGQFALINFPFAL